jgi:HEPN domain-containing protein
VPIEVPNPSRDKMRSIAKLRLKESKILLDNGYYNGAYYFCGYAVECGLKACIAKNIKRFHFPDRNFGTKCYTHDLKGLISSANLDQELNREKISDPVFDRYWTIVKDWKSDIRYYDGIEGNKAIDLYKSVSDRTHGVLKWVKKYW